MTTPTTENWSERFEEIFCMSGIHPELKDEITLFIRKELSRQREEVVERVKTMIQEEGKWRDENNFCSLCQDYSCSHDHRIEAFTKILNLLR